MKIFLICIFILNSFALDYLHYKLNLVKRNSGFRTEEYMYINTRFLGKYSTTIISFSQSKLISDLHEENFNITDIDISQDDIYPNVNKVGKIGKGNFSLTEELNLDLNFMYQSGIYYSYIGLSRGVVYNNTSIEEEFELDFISQLIRKGIVDKYYIYLSPIFNTDGSVMDSPYLEIGRFPAVFDTYGKMSSYIPFNDKYPTKWATKLTYILFGTISSTYIPENNKRNIEANVIFSDSYRRDNYISNSYRNILDTIFVDQYKCEFFSYTYKCSSDILTRLKLYFVFNGYAHLISNNLIFHNGTDEGYLYANFEFTNNIDYISLDSYIFGNYHKLFDKENNTIRFVEPNDKSSIIDVGEITGYQNRNGTSKDVPDIGFLRDWEQSLKEKERTMNETMKEIEEKKKILDKREGELNKYKENLTNWESNLCLREEDFEKEKENITKENKELKEEVKYEKEQNNKLNETIQGLNNTIEKQNENIKEKEKKIEELKAQNNDVDSLKTQNLIEIIGLIALGLIIVILILLLIRKKKIESKTGDLNIGLNNVSVE